MNRSSSLSVLPGLLAIGAFLLLVALCLATPYLWARLMCGEEGVTYAGRQGWVCRDAFGGER